MEIKLKKFGEVLTSRQWGKEALLALEPSLKDISNKEEISVNFEEILVISSSWADEFLVPLAKRYKKRLILKDTEMEPIKKMISFLERTSDLEFNKSWKASIG